MLATIGTSGIPILMTQKKPLKKSTKERYPSEEDILAELHLQFSPGDRQWYRFAATNIVFWLFPTHKQRCFLWHALLYWMWADNKMPFDMKYNDWDIYIRQLKTIVSTKQYEAKHWQEMVTDFSADYLYDENNDPIPLPPLASPTTFPRFDSSPSQKHGCVFESFILEKWFYRSMWLPSYPRSPLLALHYTNCLKHQFQHMNATMTLSPFATQFLALATAIEDWPQLREYQQLLCRSFWKFAKCNCSLFHGPALYQTILNMAKHKQRISLNRLLEFMLKIYPHVNNDPTSPWPVFFETHQDTEQIIQAVRSILPDHTFLRRVQKTLTEEKQFKRSSHWVPLISYDPNQDRYLGGYRRRSYIEAKDHGQALLLSAPKQMVHSFLTNQQDDPSFLVIVHRAERDSLDHLSPFNENASNLVSSDSSNSRSEIDQSHSLHSQHLLSTTSQTQQVPGISTETTH